MADDALVNLPDVGGDSDTWGDELNAAARELETRINVLRQYVLDNPGGGLADDSDIADLVEDLGSETRAAIIAAGLQLGTSGSTAAYGNHNHSGAYSTPAEVQTALTLALSALTTSSITGLVAALAAKAPAASPTFTGTVTVPDAAFTTAKVSGLDTALTNKAAVGLTPPEIPALDSTTITARADFITANCPGYTGKVVFNTAPYEAHPGPSDMEAGDEWIRRSA